MSQIPTPSATPMKASTTIREMLAENKIYVPSYQRAYSWETPEEGKDRKTHTDIFLQDIEDNTAGANPGRYYLGHFLYQNTGIKRYAIIDGQQRLTTMSIFLSALFKALQKVNGSLSDAQQEIYRDTIKNDKGTHFSTVDYDEDFFKDYVINQHSTESKTIGYLSSKRIKAAFDFFSKKLSCKRGEELEALLKTTIEAGCSTYQVQSEAEAIQMFIFQNNRGKTPSALEILKADFMFAIHLEGGYQTEELIAEIRRRFEIIYKTISAIEYKITEDEILNHTIRIYFNNLNENYTSDKIRQNLNSAEALSFISSFSRALENSFKILEEFFIRDEKAHHEIHSLTSLGGIGTILPFIIKAYTYSLPAAEICTLCRMLESIVLRHRLIRTRAELSTRLNWQFQQFTRENAHIQPIIERISFMKSTDDWWWRHWSNQELRSSISGGLNHAAARFLLWKYENHLQQRADHYGYTLRRFDTIENPELEHIAPRTRPDEIEANGYCEYDDEFRRDYLNCLGNYLLISKSHNCSIGNTSFADKFETYTYLLQQIQVQDLSRATMIWGKEYILKRKEDIIQFIMDSY